MSQRTSGAEAVMAFRDRTDAGVRLAEQLGKLGLDDPVVLGMARGGVPVAFEIARELDAPLDVIVVRKLGHPPQPELGLGALAEGGVRVMNDHLVAQLRVSEDLIDRVAKREEMELERRLATYRGDRPAEEVRDRTVIVVDDGLATGFTALAAVAALRRRGAKRVVLAVPVAPPTAVATLEKVADEVICLEITERFFGLSEWYADFRQVSDDEVVALLSSARSHRISNSAPRRSRSERSLRRSAPRSSVAASVGPARGEASVEEHESHPSDPTASTMRAVEIPVEGHSLPGELLVPPNAAGLVLFAHGSGSSRMSPRNLEVAATLQRSGLATLLFDLLTPAEANERSKVFDIGLLSSRMRGATSWVRAASLGHEHGILLREAMPLGFFGASTGAAAALKAAAELGSDVAAIVSRGGRPDLAGDALSEVTAPTLLIVGGADEVVVELNRQAQRRMRAESRLEVVPDATHLFEEPGALAMVAELAADWFIAFFAHMH